MGVKEKLAGGGIATMVAVNYSSPALVEYVGKLGFDIAFIDCEKGSATAERIEEMCRGGRAAGIATVVRPWTNDDGLISRYLDLGADGVMVAAVEEAETARALVAAVRYARFRDFGEKIVIAMIESPRAIENLPELLSVEGVDVWFVGPNDLAHRMGHPGRADLPEVQDAVLQALRAISASGRVAGTLATPGRARILIDAGARLLMTRVTDLLAQGSKDFHLPLQNAPVAGAAAKTTENS
jgi:2-keto-3-deoxy-L-rhamnonate aldolase RhmA